MYSLYNVSVQFVTVMLYDKVRVLDQTIDKKDIRDIECCNLYIMSKLEFKFTREVSKCSHVKDVPFYSGTETLQQLDDTNSREDR